MTTVAEAFVTLRPDLDNFKRDTESGLSNLGGLAKTAAIAIGATAVALTGVAAIAIKAAMEEQVGIDRLSQAIDSNGGSWDKLGANIEGQVAKWSKLSAFSDGEMRDALTVLVNTTGNAGTAMERLPIAMDFARGAGIDLGTASKLLGKITDETTSVLSKYGIRVDKNADSTDVLAEVQKRFAGQAQGYANTAAGAWTIFHNELDNLKEDVGTALLPIFSTFVKTATEGIDRLRSDIVPGLIARFLDLKEKAQPLLDFLGTVWTNLIVPGIRSVIDLLPKLFGSIGEIFDVLTGRRPDAGGVLASLVGSDQAAAIMGAIATVRTVLTEAINFLKPIIQGVIDKVSELRSSFESLPEPIRLAFAGLAVGQLTGANDALIGMGASFATMASGLINIVQVGPAIGSFFSLLPTQLGLMGIGFGEAAAGAWAFILPLLPLIALIAAVAIGVALVVTHWEELGDTFHMITVIVGHFVGQVGQAIGAFFSSVGSAVQSFLSFWLGVWNEISSKPGYYLGLMIGTVIGWLLNLTTLFRDTVNTVLTTVISWGGNLLSAVGNALGVIGRAWDSFWTFEMLGKLLAALGGILGQLGTWGGQVLSWLVDALGTLARGWWDFWSSIPAKMIDIGRSIVEGIWRGIQNMTSWLLTQAADFARGIFDGIMNAIRGGSPSMLFAEVGDSMVSGIALGISTNAEKVASALAYGMSGAVSAAQSAMNDIGQITAEELARFTSTVNGVPISMSNFATDLLSRTGQTFSEWMTMGLGPELPRIGPAAPGAGGIDYAKLASAMGNVNLSVNVDDVHSALLQKSVRNAGLGLT